MNNTLSPIAVALLTAALGCIRGSEMKAPEQSPEKLIEGRIDTSIDLLRHYVRKCGQAGVTNEYEFAAETIRQVQTLSNDVAEVECLERFADRLMSIDMGTLEYWQQSCVATRINNLVWRDIVKGLLASNADIERVYEMRFRLIGWLRSQLERLRPGKKMDTTNWPSLAASERHGSWRSAYHTAYINLKTNLYYLENPEWIMDSDLYKRPDNKLDDLKAIVEKWLGHPLRPKDELLKIRREISPEYKAIRAGGIVPKDF